MADAQYLAAQQMRVADQRREDLEQLRAILRDLLDDPDTDPLFRTALWKAYQLSLLV